eukprot:10819067-Ditylum_brightwellii.AAC.1
MTKPKEDTLMELKKHDLLPVQRVCADHYHCAVPGCLYTNWGSTGKAGIYTGGCIFVDNALGLVHIQHQINLSGVENVKPKLKLDRFAAEFGVKALLLHNDNGVSTYTIFMDT